MSGSATVCACQGKTTWAAMYTVAGTYGSSESKQTFGMQGVDTGCVERMKGHLEHDIFQDLGTEFLPGLLADVGNCENPAHQASLVVAHDGSHLWPLCIVRQGRASAECSG